MAPQTIKMLYRNRLSLLFSKRAKPDNLPIFVPVPFSPTASTASGSDIPMFVATSSLDMQPATQLDDLVPPPTINQLDAKSKARLIRQANKLAKVLGDTPSLDTERKSTSSITRPASSSRQSTTSELRSSIINSPTTNSSVPSIQSSSTDNISLISPFSPAPPLDGARRIKLAKLTRVLGEVPQELVFPTERPRRQSMDVSTFFEPPTTSPRAVGPALKRSRSMAMHKAALDSVDFRVRYDQNFGMLSDKQRALNVKRARKMTQLFGHEPPQELILGYNTQDDSRLSTPSLSPSASSFHTADGQASPSSITHSFSADQEQALELNVPIFEPDTPSPTLHDRRRRVARVAKLSRFFGVGSQDLTSCVPPIQDKFRPASVQVEVRLGGRRFWERSDRDVAEAQDADVHRAILDGLRALKA
ncbi:hypothetical protein C8J56DRAFT_311119 [Mycena floridula]|nr:hypothetical protein C8J56DRAFT_311119 [Mycena floridula]